MPNNYLELFEKFLENGSGLVCGLALLDNLDSKTLLQSIGLPFLGAKKIGLQLMQNILELPLKKRETLFKKNNIPVFNWPSMNSKEAVDFVKNKNIDLIVNLRTRCIYKKEILNSPNIACINIHHGLLPEYRGTFCDLYALTEGREAGFSIHEMVEKIDAGAIHKVVPIANKEAINNKGTYSYLEYLKLTSKTEAESLLELIQEIDKLGKMPEGILNKTDNKKYTKNPTPSQIKDFLNQGFIL